jgi:hypothetical protein
MELPVLTLGTPCIQKLSSYANENIASIARISGLILYMNIYGEGWKKSVGLIM